MRCDKIVRQRRRVNHYYTGHGFERKQLVPWSHGMPSDRLCGTTMRGSNSLWERNEMNSSVGFFLHYDSHWSKFAPFLLLLDLFG